MSILEQVPGPRPLRADHRTTLRRELEAVAANPSRHWRWRRPGVVLGLSIGVAVATAGAASAAVYFHFAPITDTSTAFCYSVPSLAGSYGSYVGAVGAPGSPAQVTDALQTCSTLWRDGFLVLGTPHAMHVTGSTTVHRVPSLVVCTMANGTAGVFPGDGSTCGRLGLSRPRAAADGAP